MSHKDFSTLSIAHVSRFRVSNDDFLRFHLFE